MNYSVNIKLKQHCWFIVAKIPAFYQRQTRFLPRLQI